MAHPTLTESSAAWELRAAWAGRWEVGVSLRGGRRVRGYVEHVSATSAYALVWDGRGLLHVPCSLVRAVRRPHEHEPNWGPPVAAPPERELIIVLPGQLALDVGEGARPDWWSDPREEEAARRAEVARLRAEGKRRAAARERSQKRGCGSG